MIEKCVKCINKSNAKELACLLGLNRSIEDITNMNEEIDVNSLTRKGTTLLHLACEKQDQECLKVLLSHPYININIIDPLTGWTPLITLINSGGDRDCLDILLEKRPNLSLCDKFLENSPLHWAAKLELPHVIYRLVKSGASINYVSRYSGLTPLHVSIIDSCEESASELISLSADPMIRDDDYEGYTALHLAVINNLPNIAINILESKSSIDINNCIDNSGNTPLHLAYSQGLIALANRLENYGFDNTRENVNGETPIDLYNKWLQTNKLDKQIIQESKRDIKETRNKKHHIDIDKIIETPVSQFFIKHGLAEKNTLEKDNKKNICKGEFLFKLFYKAGYTEVDDKFVELTDLYIAKIGVKDAAVRSNILRAIQQELKYNQEQLEKLLQEKAKYKRKKTIIYIVIGLLSCIVIFYITYIFLQAVVDKQSNLQKGSRSTRNKKLHSYYAKKKTQFDL
ncbi:hypothetical protein cand_009290 [Cryptosporidium andersoni]|uniref:Uncharacterized protein n=1 Tax=Cryptosporidium andersoni TaxID=117008 RepID=A0A1J4MTE5_9CRYT|nr:hypothetical protein cand_009290 [Cryptosporidium andersoni]